MPAEAAQQMEALEAQAQRLMGTFVRAGYEQIAPAIIQPAGLFLDVIGDIKAGLGESLALAEDAEADPEQLIIDPGFGFAKDTGENVELMARFEELLRFQRPLLAGTSRKRFIGALTGREAAERDAGTAATTALLRLAGAAIFRVHDVAFNRDALLMADAMVEARLGRAARAGD